jgi:L-rhamnose-H+ transport protein
VRQGASVGDAQHAIWCIGFLGGFVGNGGYAILRLFRNRTWARHRATGLGKEWPLSALMGVLFTLGFLIYGRGARTLGDLGPAIGWPVFQATTIMVSTIAGAASGEWRNAQKGFVILSISGLAVLIAAIVVLSFGNRM